MASESVIKVLITGDEFNLKKSLGEANKDLQKTSGEHSKFSGAAKVAMAGAGLAAVAFLKSSVDVAEKFQEAHDRMDNAFKNTGVEGGKWVADAEKQGQKFGYTRDKIDNALATSVRALGTAGGAHKALNVAEDISAATGMDLQDSTLMVTKATEGNTKALKKLGIEYTGAKGGAQAVAAAQKGVAGASDELKKAQDKLVEVQMRVKDGQLKGAAAGFALMAAHGDVAKASENLKAKQKALADAHAAGGKIVDLLASKYKGSAADASKTFEGKMKALHASFTNFEATVGNKVIPILTALLGWFMKHQTILKVLLAVVGLVVAALVAYTIAQKIHAAALKIGELATKAFTAAQWLFNAAMDANPIALVVIAIAALAAGVIYAYGHFKWFRTFIQKAWEILQSGFNWVKDHWPLILAILTGPIGIAVMLIIGHFNQIKHIASNIIGWFQTAWNKVYEFVIHPFATGAMAVIGFFAGVVNWFSDLPNKIGNVIGGIIDVIKGPFRAAFNGVASLWNNTVGSLSFSIPSWVPGIGGDGFSMPKIPTLHTGGVFQTGASGGEGLALLRNGEAVFTPEQMYRMLTHGSAGGGGVTINMPAGIDAASVVREQRRYNSRNGIR